MPTNTSPGQRFKLIIADLSKAAKKPEGIDERYFEVLVNSGEFDRLNFPQKFKLRRVVGSKLFKLIRARNKQRKNLSKVDTALLRSYAASGELKQVKRIVEKLVGANGKLDVVDAKIIESGKRTPLEYAIANGKKQVAEYLIAKGASLPKRPDNDPFFLDKTLLEEMRDLSKQPVQLPKGTEQAVSSRQLSAESRRLIIELASFAVKGETEKIRERLEKADRDKVRVDINTQIDVFDDGNNPTILDYAIANGHEETARYLIGRGADPAITTDDKLFFPRYPDIQELLKRARSGELSAGGAKPQPVQQEVRTQRWSIIGKHREKEEDLKGPAATTPSPNPK